MTIITQWLILNMCDTWEGLHQTLYFRPSEKSTCCIGDDLEPKTVPSDGILSGDTCKQRLLNEYVMDVITCLPIHTSGTIIKMKATKKF